MRWRHSNTVIGPALAVLIVLEIMILLSSLSDGIRYGLSGAIVVVQLLGAGQLSVNRRAS